MKKTIGFFIDNQNDFADPQGALYVSGGVGGKQAMVNLSNFVSNNKAKINNIVETYDIHHRISVFSPFPYRKHDGGKIDPFTVILNDDVKNGKFKGVNDGWHKHLLWYTEQVEAHGRAPLVIWPVHCQMMRWGSNLVEPLQESFDEWSDFHGRNYEGETKGVHPMTENFSIFRAEIPIPGAKSTKMNEALIKKLIDPEVDTILLAGLAQDYCVYYSLMDLINEFPDPKLVEKIVVLKDCTAHVEAPGWEDRLDKFDKLCNNNNIQQINSRDWN